MFEAFLIGAVIVSGAVNVGYLIAGYRSKKTEFVPQNKPTIKQKCSGYTTAIGILYSDCKAHQSSNCKDGRCSFHCNQNCKCERLEVPQFDKFVKRSAR